MFIKYIKKYWYLILLIIFLFIICLISFKYGKYLLANDNYSPELNSSLTIERSITSPAWRTYRTLGFASESEQADIFRSIFFYILDILLPRSILGQIFYLISLAIGTFSISFLTKDLFNDSKLKKYSNIGFLFSGFVYINTLWTAWLFYQDMAPYIANFGFLTLLILNIYRYIKKPSSINLIYIFISSILLTSTFVIATLFVVDFIFISSFILFFSYIRNMDIRKTLVQSIKVLLLFIPTQLFWILPFIFYTLSVSQDIVGSLTNRFITSSVIDLESQMQTAINTARMYNRILTDSTGDALLFPYSDSYFQYDFFKVIGLIPAFLSLVGLIFSIIKKNWKLVILFLFGFASWFLIKVDNSPLGNIFIWLQDNIPLFRQVFRWPFSKLGQVFLISLTICSSFGLIYLFKFFKDFSKKKFWNIFLSILFVLIFVSPTFLYSEYIFSGNLFPERALHDLPEEYFSLGKYLEENDSEGRIYYAPPSNNNYFRQYEWGFRGSQFISYILPNPVMDMSLAVGSDVGENAMFEIYDTFKAGDKERFVSVLEKYDVKYLLVDRSLISSGFTYDIDWDLSENLWKDMELVWQENFLSMYKVSEEKSTLVEYVNVSNTSSFSKYFVREESKSPTLLPLYTSFENIVFEEGYLKGEFTYTGENTRIYSNVKYLKYSDFPSQVKYQDGNIYISPSYPYLKTDEDIKNPEKIYQSHSDIFVISNYVFDKNDLEKEKYIQDKYGNIENIYGVKKESFKDINLTNLLSSSEGGDCAEDTLGYLTDISSIGNASGLSLEGTSNLPCTYTNIPLKDGKKYILEVNLNWEAQKGSIAGYCLYSKEKERCLNKEKFISIDEPFAEKTFLIPELVSGNDKISLILYVIGQENIQKQVTFKNVSIRYSSEIETIEKKNETTQISNTIIDLKNGEKYKVIIPLPVGSNGYTYNASSELIWQPNFSSSTNSNLSLDNGLIQEVEEGFFNISTNLFKTNPNSEYMIFWNGKNISNIPSNICLTYSNSSSCWYQDILLSNQADSRLQFFESSNISQRLDAVLNSTSYNHPTVNKLSTFAVLETPNLWKEIEYNSIITPQYTEYEAENISNSPHSTIYSFENKDIDTYNSLLSIPQARSDGWIAFVINNNKISILNEKVNINGWKQGWDISNTSFDNIYILYYPNLLAYIGYIIILIEIIYIPYILIKERNKDGK